MSRQYNSLLNCILLQMLGAYVRVCLIVLRLILMGQTKTCCRLLYFQHISLKKLEIQKHISKQTFFKGQFRKSKFQFWAIFEGPKFKFAQIFQITQIFLERIVYYWDTVTTVDYFCNKIFFHKYVQKLCRPIFHGCFPTAKLFLHMFFSYLFILSLHCYNFKNSKNPLLPKWTST